MEKNKETKQNWTGLKRLGVCRLFLAAITKILFLEMGMGTRITSHPIFRFS